MTVGVYYLYWHISDMVYIGQSTNIESRIKKHIYQLSAGIHYNKSMLYHYQLEGIPEYGVLEKCEISNLNIVERSWIEEFDSIRNGLNQIMPGFHHSQYGNRKYSRTQILKVFSCLYNTSLSQQKIADKIGVSINLVQNISDGKYHTWLGEEYPIKYKQMLEHRRSTKNKRQTIGDKLPESVVIVSPLGDEYTITNIAEFCRTNSILCTKSTSTTTSNISRLINSEIKSYLGFYLKGNKPKVITYILTSPNNTIYNTTNLWEFCKTYGNELANLNSAPSSLLKVCKGTYSHYKRWKVTYG